MGNYIDEVVARIREQVGDDEVILGLSGGVDSSVAAALIHKAIGDQLTCGPRRPRAAARDEGRLVMDMFTEHRHMKVIAVDASEGFLGRLPASPIPRAKRKIRQRVRRGLHARGGQAEAGEVAGAGNDLPRRDRVGRRQDQERRSRSRATTTSAGCRQRSA
jgi:NH3-dependent NAD+ synthetase